jgi:hypothetical protein
MKGTAMKHSQMSNRQLKSVVKICFAISIVLFSLYIYDALAPAVVSHFKQAPAGTAATAAQAASDASVGVLADQIFVFVIPVVIIFLIYIAVVLSTLAKNLSRTNVCSHDNPTCGFNKKYFS